MTKYETSISKKVEKSEQKNNIFNNTKLEEQ